MVPINIPHSQQAGRLAVRQSPLVAAWHVLGTAYFSKWGHFLGRLTGRYSGNVGNLPEEQFLSFDNLHHHHPTIICFFGHVPGGGGQKKLHRFHSEKQFDSSLFICVICPEFPALLILLSYSILSMTRTAGVSLDDETSD